MDITRLNIHTPLELINEFVENTLIANLGIKITGMGEGWVEASMPVDSRTFRPGNFLHGGASLALAETISGLGSMLLTNLEEYEVLGIQVTGNHTGSVSSGVVKARAEIVHRGNQTHVWNVDVKSGSGRLISSIRVTNMIVKRNG